MYGLSNLVGQKHELQVPSYKCDIVSFWHCYNVTLLVGCFYDLMCQLIMKRTGCKNVS